MESRSVAELEARFQGACDSAVETCRSLTPPYIPTTWISMCQRLGAAEASAAPRRQWRHSDWLRSARSSRPATAHNRVGHAR